MKQLKAAHTMITEPHLTARWARKSPSKTTHYKRRGAFYLAEVAKMVLVASLCYLIACGSLKMMFGE
jgi:hypothetical protein